MTTAERFDWLEGRQCSCSMKDCEDNREILAALRREHEEMRRLLVGLNGEVDAAIVYIEDSVSAASGMEPVGRIWKTFDEIANAGIITRNRLVSAHARITAALSDGEGNKNA